MNNTNNHPSSIKSYIIIGIVVVVAALVYFYFSGSAGTPSETLGQTDVTSEAVGLRVLGLLNQISSLKIDNKLFEDSIYVTLRDYTVQVPTLPVGRINPFAPIPGLAIPSGNSGAGH